MAWDYGPTEELCTILAHCRLVAEFLLFYIKEKVET